jgi:hypothetical protein
VHTLEPLDLPLAQVQVFRLFAELEIHRALKGLLAELYLPDAVGAKVSDGPAQVAIADQIPEPAPIDERVRVGFAPVFFAAGMRGVPGAIKQAQTFALQHRAPCRSKARPPSARSVPERRQRRRGFAD